jgi:putative NADH-flavin reductase
LLAQALERGMNVNVVVRDKSKIAPVHNRLHVFEGMPTDRTVLEQAMQGCTAVLSALNVSRASDWPWAALRSPKTLLSSTMKLVTDLAPRHAIDRIIVVSAWGAGDSRKEIPGWFRWLIEHSNLRFPYHDHERQEQVLIQSPLKYTIVRPAGLLNSRKTKKLRVSINNDPKPHLTVGRLALAGFMLDILQHSEYLRKTIVLSW